MQTTLRYFCLLILLFALAACEDAPEDTPSPEPSSYYNALGSKALGDASGDGSTSEGTVDPTLPGSGQAPVPGQITAGEWSDLTHWDFWQNLKDNEYRELSEDLWGFRPDQRYRLRVLDRYNRPVVDAEVSLLDAQGDAQWVSRTDAEGGAELWSQALETSPTAHSLSVSYRNQTATLDALTPFTKGEMRLHLDTERICPDRIDLVFTVDATSSMSDELEYLKSELNDVVTRIEPTANVRLGAVFYRDQGDAYVVRSFPFTADISQMIGHIQAQSADGGGDTPEAVHSALEEAILKLDWSENATARIMFLLLDAPPHEDPQVKEDMQRMIRKAAKEGVRIIPVSASGIDEPTEFLLRSIAILTQGTYVFVTDHSGIGNDHLEPTVGEYEVELLNDLLVRLINQYGARCGVEL